MNKDEYSDLVIEIFRYFGDTLDLDELQMNKVSRYLERLSKASQENNLFIKNGPEILYELYSWEN
jgi:hypothetical protein